MTEICRTPITHPSAWRGSDFASPNEFAIELGPRHLQAFERALAHIRTEGLGLDDIERGHFDVPEIAGDIAAWFEEIQHGRGFVFLRGFPVDECSVEEIGIIYWGTSRMACGRPSRDARAPEHVSLGNPAHYSSEPFVAPSNALTSRHILSNEGALRADARSMLAVKAAW